MMKTTPLIYIVDDDSSVRKSLTALMKSIGYTARAFGSAVDFLYALHHASSKGEPNPNCVILDVRMPKIDGLQIQEILKGSAATFGIILMTAFADVEMTVKAMRAGAINFLEKPFHDEAIIHAVHEALLFDSTNGHRRRFLDDLQRRFNTLTARERTLLDKVGRGLLNKQIASEMNLSEITIKVQRRELMRKMGARSHVELIRFNIRLAECASSIHAPRSQPADQIESTLLAFSENWPTSTT